MRAMRRPALALVLTLIASSAGAETRPAAVAAPTEKPPAAVAIPGERPLDALVRRAGELDTDALVVMRNGKVVLEKWFDGAPRKIESMSVTKSVVALAFGRLLETRALRSLDEPVSTYYPEWRQGRKRGVTIRHLLTQTSGLQADRMTGTEVYPAPDFVQLALCAELTDDPGTRFFYNNKATNLLAGVVQKISGKRLDDYLEAEVFAPLGITDVAWTLDAAGNPHGMSGLQIRPADLARLGQLMLDEGRWKGKQLLSRAWVRAATQPGAVQPGYGHLWWMVNDSKMIVIDDELAAGWRKAGSTEAFIAALMPLEGKVFEREAFFAAIKAALVDQGGLEAWYDNTWRRGQPDGKPADVRTIGFRADGWQGQAVIVLKKERLVVVRMREPKDNSEEENQRYGFSDLTRFVRALK